MEQEIQIKSPIHPENEQRIILLNADKLQYKTSSGSSQNTSRPLSSLTMLLMIIALSFTKRLF